MAKTEILNSRLAVEDCDAVMAFCADAHAESKEDGRSCSSSNDDKKESGRPIIVDLDGPSGGAKNFPKSALNFLNSNA